MKMIYLANFFSIMNENDIGVWKKVFSQTRAFAELGYEPLLIMFDDFRVYKADYMTHQKEICYFSSIKKTYEYVLQILKEISPELIYIRYRFIVNHYINEFYQSLSESFNTCICEIPTYPYDDEFKKNSADLIIDQYYRIHLKDYFKFIVSYGIHTEILGLPTISISNGIDLKEISRKKVSDKKKKINLVAMASMNFWHGFDRVLEGLYQYYQNDPTHRIEFYMIGKGPESDRYHCLIKKYKLNQYVHEMGIINDQKRLKEIFDDMDIAIGSVGMHRANCEVASPIKAAEYCARGIPFVIGYNDISFDEKFEYILKVNRSEEPINIEKILAFYQKLDLDKAANDMHQYAEEKLTWTGQMKKVLDRLW